MSDSSRLVEAMSEWARRVEAGLPLDPREFANGYPDIADELGLALEFEAKLDRACQRMGGPPPVHSLPAGAVFADYVIVREVGRGGMGVVYEAWQPALSRRVALKLLSSAIGSSPRERQRFLCEARIVALLDSPHVVEVYDAGEHAGIPYFAMRFIDGVSLARVLADERENPTRDESSYTRRIAEFGAQAAEALADAHGRGVVHCDVKPSNLLVKEAHLWVTDFGLARARDLTDAASSHRPAGTVRYMSPEQFAGTAAPFDGRADVFSLGVTLYELLTLHHPGVDWAGREPAPLRQHRPAVPVELETVVLKAMAAEPDDRYAGAREMADDLRRFLGGGPVKARPVTRWQRVRRVLWRRRRLVAAITATLAVGLTVGLSIGGVWLLKEYQETERQRRITLDTVRELLRVVAEHVRHEPGKAAEEKRAIDKVLPLAERAAEQAPPEHELHEAVALMTSRLATIEAWLGNLERAEQLQEIALAKLRRLISTFPDRAKARLECVLVLEVQLQRLVTLERFAEAEACLGEALSHLEILLGDEPDKPEYLDRKAMVQLQWARLLHQSGRSDEAVAKAGVALGICDQLRRRFPTGHPLSYIRLCWVYHSLGGFHAARGEASQAERVYREMLAIDRRLAREYPNRLRLREATIHSAVQLAELLIDQGRVDEAAPLVTEAIAESRAALKAHPDVFSFRSVLLIGWRLRGMLAYAAGDPAARAAFAEVVAIVRGARWEGDHARSALVVVLGMPYPELLDLKECRARVEEAGLSERESRLLRGLLALRGGDDAEAMRLLGDAAALPKGEVAAARYALAILHARRGEREEARRRLAEAERLAAAAPVGPWLRLEARRAVEGR